MKSCCLTCQEAIELLESALKEMSPRERAQLRVELRKANGLPAQPEPDLWIN